MSMSATQTLQIRERDISIAVIPPDSRRSVWTISNTRIIKAERYVMHLRASYINKISGIAIFVNVAMNLTLVNPP